MRSTDNNKACSLHCVTSPTILGTFFETTNIPFQARQTVYSCQMDKYGYTAEVLIMLEVISDGTLLVGTQSAHIPPLGAVDFEHLFFLNKLNS